MLPMNNSEETLVLTSCDDTAMASPMPSGSSKQRRSAANVPQKSTCLICSHPLLVPQEETDSDAALKWSRLIKTLCFHMQMDSKEIPKHCSTAMFPICAQCEQHAVKLYESQQKIDEAEKIITKTIVTIERTVADAEILRESLKTGSISAEGKKLRDTILEGHRAKLLMKAKLREQLVLGTGKKGKILDLPTCTHTAVMNDPSIRRQFNAGRSGGPSPSTSQGNNAAQNESLPNSRSSPVEKDKDNKEQEDQAENPSGSTNGPAEVHDLNPPPTPVAPYNRALARKTTSMVPAARPAPGSPPSRMVAQYNENSCTMTISKVPCGPASPPPLDPSIVVKEEPRSPSPIPVQHGKRKRRSLFQGIEILKISDTVTNKVYLQCSICRHPVLLNNPLNSDVSPHQMMTQHITNRHLSKRRRAALQNDASTSVTATANNERKRQFTCKICCKVFPDMRTYIKHKTTHSAEERTARENENTEMGMAKSYYIPNLQCNICGRPIKGNLTNLEVHKFSHKNNEEKLEAIKKNERGARNVTIRKLGAKASRPGVVNEDSKKVGRVRKSRKGKVFPGLNKKKIKALILKEKPSSVNGSFNCRHCSRSFSRNCHFVLHMQMHYRQNKVLAVTQAPNDEPPSVKDLQVNGTQVVNENPKTCEDQPTSSAEEVSAEFSSEEIDNILAETDNPNGDEMQV